MKPGLTRKASASGCVLETLPPPEATLDVRVGWGIEAQGNIERSQQHEVLIGIYTQPSERFTFKAGAGLGLGNGKPAPEIRTGVVWHF